MTVSIDTQGMAQVSRTVALEDAAMRFAELDPTEAEATIDAFAAGAIAAWRLEDATYWQRVRYRARLIRTMRRAEAHATPVEANSLPKAAKTDGGDR